MRARSSSPTPAAQMVKALSERPLHVRVVSTWQVSDTQFAIVHAWKHFSPNEETNETKETKACGPKETKAYDLQACSTLPPLQGLKVRKLASLKGSLLGL